MQSQGLNVASLQNIMKTVDKPISRSNTGFPRIAQAYVSYEMKKNFCQKRLSRLNREPFVANFRAIFFLGFQL
jgi:hypothetical protein